MTIGIAWIGTRRDGREYLYIASDSRVTGGQRLDCCPKIITLPRSDCAICFAGDTGTAYPLMMQIANAIAAHQPARERSLDIARLKVHLLRVFSDIVGRIADPVQPFASKDVQFLFGGYSWASKQFRIWTIDYIAKDKRFAAREAKSFHSRLQKAAFIGDWSRLIRSAVFQDLNNSEAKTAYLEPLRVLAETLSPTNLNRTIGGPPQLVRITQHMNTRPLCIRWKDEDTLFGRPLFPYENVDYWMVDPFSGKLSRPRKFGIRSDHIEAEPNGQLVECCDDDETDREID
jgi:hypothetical protein